MTADAFRASNRTAAAAAGALSGVAGLLVFLALHHLWIGPIWFVLPLGLVIAGLGGLAVGRAYAEIRPELPPRPWTAPAVVALIAFVLAPATILAELRAPYFTLTSTGSELAVPVAAVVAGFLGELVLTATLMGALAGRVVGGTRRAAGWTALAGLAFALGPGHNIPLIGGTPGVGKELAILLVVTAAAAVTLVETDAVLRRRGSGSTAARAQETTQGRETC